MEATILLVAQGRYHEINDQVWSSLNQSQREEILSLIPVTEEFEFYAKLCPDPISNQNWHIDRAIATANLVGPIKAVKMLTFAYKSNMSPMIKMTMDDLFLFSKLQSILGETYESLPRDRANERNHVDQVFESLRFPSNLAELFIEPWLCTTLLTGGLDPEIYKQLSTKLLPGDYEDVLFSLSELNCRQVGLTTGQSRPRTLDLTSLLASLKMSQSEGLSTAKAILGPVGFDIETTKDLRDALCQIIGENQALAVSAADEHCDWSLLEPVLRSNATGLSNVNLGLVFECLSHLNHK